MHLAVFFVLMTLALIGERAQQLMEPIHLLFRSHAYEIKMTLVESDGSKYPSTECVVSTVFLSPLERASLPGLKTRLVRAERGRKYEIRRTISFRVTRLPFGLFLARLKIEGTSQEATESSPTPLRLAVSRIVFVGRVIHVDLGRDTITGDNRTWELSIKDEKRQPGPMIPPPKPFRVSGNHK